MQIMGQSLKVPARILTNNDVLTFIAERSHRCFDGDLAETLAKVDHMLQTSGIESRHILEDGEPWFPYAQKAATEALQQANLEARDIDCLIYASVYRTMLEPSMACLVAKALGMRWASAFDINEACGSWARAASLAQTLLQQGVYRHILIITSENFAPPHTYGAGGFALTKPEDLAWAFSTYTMGCAATATIFKVDPEQPWQIHHYADNHFAEECLFPLPIAYPEEHHLGSVSSAGLGPDKFTCYGQKLQIATLRTISRFVDRYREEALASKLFIPHTQAYKAYQDLLKIINLKADLYSLYPQFGNIVSSSLPAALTHAHEAGRLKRGDKVFMMIPASGLTVFTFHFRF